MKGTAFNQLLVGFITILFATQCVHSAVRVFGDKNAFSYALSNALQSKLTFDDFPVGPISGLEFTNAGFIFSSPLAVPAGQLEIAPPDFFWETKYLNVGKRPYAPGSDGENDSLIVDILGSWTAVALEFVDSHFPGNANTTVTFYGDSSNIIYSVSAQNRNFSFIGVIADVPIRKIYINEAANDGDDVGYDNFWLGNPAPAFIERPLLTISYSSTGLILTWPSQLGDYQLEVSDSLVSGEWEPVWVVPVLTNGVYTVTLPVYRDTEFYRLRRLY